MRRAIAVAADVLREAASRRWVLAIFVAVTLVLATVLLALRLEVVDGALAASRLFGRAARVRTLQPVDVALRPLFEAAAAVTFWGALWGGILGCADFAPRLLAPGRIEHLLALPLRRGELVCGTFLGVLALLFAGNVYGAGGLAVILWAKTGVFNAGPLVAGAVAVVAFAAVYAVMLLSAVVVRSAALAAVAGATLAILGVVASYRATILPMFTAGVTRDVAAAALGILPRLATLGGVGMEVSLGRDVAWARVAATAGGAAVFAVAALAAAVTWIDRRDY